MALSTLNISTFGSDYTTKIASLTMSAAVSTNASSSDSIIRQTTPGTVAERNQTMVAAVSGSSRLSRSV